MGRILKYEKQHELELILLLKDEPDWNSFTSDQTIEKFKAVLLTSETFIYEYNNKVCGYIRALVDEFGIYISEIYVAPSYRNHGYGKELLKRLKEEHLDQEIYVLSDEDLYYQKLGLKRIGSIFKL